MQALLNLQPVSDANNLPALKSLHNKVNISINSLKTLGRSLETYSSTLLFALRKALPAKIYFEFSEAKNRLSARSIAAQPAADLCRNEEATTPLQKEVFGITEPLERLKGNPRMNIAPKGRAFRVYRDV